MLRSSKLLLAVLVLAAAGCGSSDSKKKTKTTADGKATPAGKGEKEADPKLCGKLGITPDTAKQGKCNLQQGDKTYSVRYVNGKSKLKMDELELTVEKVSTPASVAGIEPKDVTDKNGKTFKKAFVAVELTWKNTGDKARRLNPGGKQIKIRSTSGGGAVFPLVDRTAPDSFFNADKVKPGGKQTGVVVFQVPEELAEAVKLRGSRPALAVWEFSTAGKPQALPTGFIRLWNA